jgi:hypothetical protein
LKSLNSRKRKIWILLPLALNFLPPDLEFPSFDFDCLPWPILARDAGVSRTLAAILR